LQPVTSQRAKTALVVEDHNFQRRTLARMLRSFGFENVLEASDGLEALQVLREFGKIDILLCDLDMDEMDGMELIRNIAHSDSVGSIIIISAHEPALLDAAARMTRAYGLNLLGIVEKPLTISILNNLLGKNGERVAPILPTRHFELDEILDGIQLKEFESFFQPKLYLSTGHVAGAEALVRWRHPKHGIIGPIEFIPALERAGRIDELTFAVLEQASLACQRWHQLSPGLTVSVNLSLRSLSDPDLAEQILSVSRAAELEPQYMILEITETAAVENVAATLENFVRLRMRGFGLSIDDYGTGFASLQQLQLAPFTELKIDKSFVNGCAEQSSSRAIVESSIQMAKRLGFQSVGEGVETQADLNILKDAGCDMAQGYLIARPMVHEKFMDFIANGDE
jgi:EAL domain-containing protein (putative c-di-GMP-specific phosphodiesterase class I)